DRLAGVEALDEEHVDPVVLVLAGSLGAGEVDGEHAVTRVRVMDDVEGPVPGRDDRSVVDDVRARDLDEGAVPRARDRPRLEAREREAVRARLRDTSGAEVWCAGEVDDRLA